MNKNIKKYTPLFAFAFFALASILLWGYELIYAIDEKTGFIEPGHWSSYLMTGLLLFGICFLIVLPFFTSKNVVGIKQKKRPVTGVLGIIFGGVLVVETVIAFASSAPPNVIVTISAVAASLFIIFMAINLIFGQNYSFAGVFAIVPAIWACIRLAVNFMKYTTIANISGNLFDVLMMVFTVMFLFYQANLIAGIDTKKSYRFTQGFGLCASLFCLMCTLPRLLLNLDHSSYETINPSLSDLILAIYALVFVVSIIHGNKTTDDKDKPEDNIPPISAKKAVKSVVSQYDSGFDSDLQKQQPPVIKESAEPEAVLQPQTEEPLKNNIQKEAAPQLMDDVKPDPSDYENALSKIYNLIDDLKKD